jgi:pyruvate dehydrogenase E2 component (dihydrolipoamide acetyltransferase)
MAERVFALPDLGEGLEEAVVSAWLVAEGDAVELNQPFVEIETAKAVVEVPAPWPGRVVAIHAEPGATVAVGAALITFDVVGESAPASSGVAASPAVRRVAKDLGVDLTQVPGSGPGGRVTREDVEAQAAPEGGPIDEIEVTPIRRSIAERLTEAAAIPQVTTFRTLDCAALDAFRRDLGVSPLPVFVRTLAEIVPGHPMLNASWTGRTISVHREVNVGIATDTERGLVVPVVANAGSRGIGEIAAEIERLARAAREGGLSPGDTSGATIAVSNTGSYGSEFGTPLLNPGHAVTIALGIIAPRALVVDGLVQARPACTLSCTFDHRVLDGATVGRALGDLVGLLGSRERLGALPR